MSWHLRQRDLVRAQKQGRNAMYWIAGGKTPEVEAQHDCSQKLIGEVPVFRREPIELRQAEAVA